MTINPKYDPQNFEKKWQERWQENGVFETSRDIVELREKPKYYALDMFPYPSGDGLHVGHPKGYTATDVVSRTKRMQGFNVLHPMGWDAFGLPAERAAQKTGQDVAEMTQRNVNNFKRQIQSLGLSYDWTRELSTTDPEYYKWTQWIFTQLYEKGLAYKAYVPVNYCPALGTVVANEEVKNGTYIETGDPVEVREMEQWMLAITKYADRLLEDLDLLDWPKGLKKQQVNWIGKSEGLALEFKIPSIDDSLKIFTSRAETIYGATYCAIALDHPLTKKLLEDSQIQEFERISEQSQAAAKNRAAPPTALGIKTTTTCLHPITNEELPIYIAPYVLSGYGTGAIMGVPAHDDRDNEFALAHGIEIKTVIDLDSSCDETMVNSDVLNGHDPDTARELISDEIGTRETHYKLRDWLFSRQRYWGEPFPIVITEDGETIAAPLSDLPIELPTRLDGKGTGSEFPLDRAPDEWKFVELPDGRIAARELNTMPQWAGSCWYYLRFIDPQNSQEAWSPELENYWMPVDLYVGGAEHAVLHLLYSRFWHKVLYDAELVSTIEPFQKLLNQGMITAESFQDSEGRYYHPNDVVHEQNIPYSVEGKPLRSKIEKMSKSKSNVVNPDDVVKGYGADSMRLYEMFMGRLSDGGPWNIRGIQGTSRYLRRVYNAFTDPQTGESNPAITSQHSSETASGRELRDSLDRTIASVSRDIDSVDKLNTAISSLMEFSKEFAQTPSIPKDVAEDYLKIMSPFAPHLAEELWHNLGHESFISMASWPEIREITSEVSKEVTVQVNGKFRARINVPETVRQADLQDIVLQDPKVERAVGNRAIKQVHYVPGKVINLRLA